VWRLVLHTQVLKTFRVFCGSLRMCVLAGPLLDPFLNQTNEDPHPPRYSEMYTMWYHQLQFLRLKFCMCFSLHFFTFVWPCIVTNFFVIKPTRCINSQIYFGMKLYMFRTVRLSIVRSLLYTQQWNMSYRFVDSFRAEPGWNCSVSSWFYYKETHWMVG
jgi:hypothetical protein